MNIEERKAALKDLQGLSILIGIINLIVICFAVYTGYKVFIVISIVLFIEYIVLYHSYKKARKALNLYLIKEALK